MTRGVGFFSASELSSLQEFSHVAFVDSVDIWPRSRVTNESDPKNIYEDAGETWDYRETVYGWIYSQMSADSEVVGHVIGTLSTYKLLLPADTELHPGDRVFVKSAFYEVIDTVSEATWLPLLRCALRRIE